MDGPRPEGPSGYSERQRPGNAHRPSPKALKGRNIGIDASIPLELAEMYEDHIIDSVDFQRSKAVKIIKEPGQEWIVVVDETGGVHKYPVEGPDYLVPPRHFSPSD